MSGRRPIRGSASLAIAALIVIGAAGCSQAPTGAPPTATPAPTPTNGPTAYAAWVARQGFGGDAGLANVKKLAIWLGENARVVTPYQLNGDRSDIDLLAAWLDDHPATACWADVHDALRNDLAMLDTLYQKAIAELAAGEITLDTTDAIASTASAAADRSAPPSCS
jgi:hypothetical protein